MPRVVVFWTTSTMKDEKSAAKFHYIKTVSGKVVEHSICLSIGINILAGGRPLRPEILAASDLPLLKAVSFDTFCLVLAGLTNVMDGQTDRPRYSVGNNRPRLRT